MSTEHLSYLSRVAALWQSFRAIARFQTVDYFACVVCEIHSPHSARTKTAYDSYSQFRMEVGTWRCFIFSTCILKSPTHPEICTSDCCSILRSCSVRAALPKTISCSRSRSVCMCIFDNSFGRYSLLEVAIAGDTVEIKNGGTLCPEFVVWNRIACTMLIPNRLKRCNFLYSSFLHDLFIARRYLPNRSAKFSPLPSKQGLYKLPWL